MATIPINDLRRQPAALRAAVEEAVRRVLASGSFVLGAEGAAFERELAAYVGRAHGLGVGNGTDALELALRALGCGPGDEVVTVANAGMYTASACVLLGAVPVFVDVEPDTLLMSPASLAQALSPRTRAVVVTHLYGRLAAVEAIADVLAGRGVALVEDCAQAHGAARGGRRAGAFGDAAAFSFYPTKNLGAVGDAGAIVTDRADVAERVRRLRQYGWSERHRAAVPGGRNSRLDEVQAAVLRVKLPHLEGWNARRRAIAARYRAAAEGTRLRLLGRAGEDDAAHLCVGRHPDREAFRRGLLAAGVDTAVHYPVPDHRQEALQGLPWRAVDLAHTEAAVREQVTLPCFPELTDEEVETVCAAIRREG